MTNTYRGIKFAEIKNFSVPNWYWDGRPKVIYLPTPETVHNLIDMAAAIRNTPPPVFDMGNYFEVDEAVAMESEDEWFTPNTVARTKKIVHGSCGTSACAIGTAAYNNIGEASSYTSWGDYAEGAFGIATNSWVWEYLFSASWEYNDNTAEGAAARILHLVIDGAENIDYNGFDKTDQYQKFKEIEIS